MFQQGKPIFNLGLSVLMSITLGSGMSATANAASTDAADDSLSPQVTVSQGTLRGTPADASGILSFKGIPYAQPPVGNLRWKEPQPAAPWSGELDASQYRASCWSASGFGLPDTSAVASEDCLYLNVWSGAKSAKAKLPVMVWIHGGGFQFGSGGSPDTRGEVLAKKGVIVVTLNYRLGVFGYLSRPDLDAESNGHKSGMYGILDQIEALKWVKTNIAAFGGDPDNVTIFGESAGAHAVGFLMASAQAKGLFHKAIGESGAFWESEMKSRKDALAFGAELGEKLSAPTIDKLRGIPARDLHEATNWNLTLPTKFSPLVDGYVLTELPYATFAHGRQNDVPLLVGWNLNEGGAFMSYSFPHATAAEFTQAATKAFGAQHMDEFNKLYPSSTAEQLKQSAQALVGDLTIKNETWTWAKLQQKTGRAPVYVYNFTFTSAFTPSPIHTAEIAYVFKQWVPGPFHKPVQPSAEDLKVADTVQSYWANFAIKGDPNGEGLPQWPKYKGPGSSVIDIGENIQTAPEEGTARFKFLEQFRGKDGLITVGQH